MQTVIQWPADDDEAPPPRPATVLRWPEPAHDADDDITPALADELGRILGEALAAQFRSDVRNSGSPAGIHRPAGESPRVAAEEAEAEGEQP